MAPAPCSCRDPAEHLHLELSRFGNSVLHNCTHCKRWHFARGKITLQERGEAPVVGVSECPVVLCNESAVGESERAVTTRVTTVPLIQSPLPSQSINAASWKL